MPRKNPTLSFTATPDLKEQIESIAKAANVSRSKAIAGLVSQSLSEPKCDHLLLEIEVLTKALEEEANKAQQYAQLSEEKHLEVECLIAYYKAEIQKLQERVPVAPKFESSLSKMSSHSQRLWLLSGDRKTVAPNKVKILFASNIFLA